MKKELIYVVALLAGLLIGCGIVTINILVMAFAFVLMSAPETIKFVPIALLTVVLTMTVTIAALRSIPESYDALFVNWRDDV